MTCSKTPKSSTNKKFYVIQFCFWTFNIHTIPLNNTAVEKKHLKNRSILCFIKTINFNLLHSKQQLFAIIIYLSNILHAINCFVLFSSLSFFFACKHFLLFFVFYYFHWIFNCYMWWLWIMFELEKFSLFFLLLIFIVLRYCYNTSFVSIRLTILFMLVKQTKNVIWASCIYSTIYQESS